MPDHTENDGSDTRVDYASSWIHSAPRRGYLTTEFWITLVVVLLGSLMAAGVFGEDQVARIVGAILDAAGVLGYGVSRGLAKR